ncbi:peroxiredoxin family protein [Gloeobacter violaceus]|uniref:Glr0029 protein n=1 Tax=Gloeobacter violaceus (strain ATCC 29082 / PCC 7421) TaxID=251221 RepID=Q7NPM6_GLOVI|nr:peroxiredoxin family protein [Gloeobacter violaceus]BAC87970.1 glr0029 [Gloeobacter violaceus PCC 7421]
MTADTRLFNQRFAKNFLPLPGFSVPAVGEAAPDFVLPRVGGAPVRLSDYRGRMPVVIAFTRIFTEKLFCPFCYPHLQDLKNRYGEIRQAGAELLMVTSTDPVQSAQVVADLALPYPFLFDPGCTLFQAYGAGQALGAPLPAQYIVDMTGTIVYRHLFSFIDSNASTDEVLAVLKALQKV